MIICPKNISIQRIEIWPLVSLHPQGSHARQRKCLIFAMLMRMTRVNKMSGWMAGRMVGGRSWREGWLWKGGRVPAVGQTNINGVPTHLPDKSQTSQLEGLETPRMIKEHPGTPWNKNIRRAQNNDGNNPEQVMACLHNKTRVPRLQQVPLGVFSRKLFQRLINQQLGGVTDGLTFPPIDTVQLQAGCVCSNSVCYAEVKNCKTSVTHCNVESEI